MSEPVTTQTEWDTGLPADYARPSIFSAPDPDKLEEALRRLPSETDVCVVTNHYAHAVEGDERVMVAYRLVERLCGLGDLPLAYHAVWTAIERGLIRAHRRFEVVLAKPAGRPGRPWDKEVVRPWALVTDFDPDHQVPGPDGMPPAGGHFQHLRWKYESFVVTYSPTRVPAFLAAMAKKPGAKPDSTDGPIDPDCRQFRFGKKSHTFTKTQALVVSRLWKVLRSGNGPVHVGKLLEDIMTRPFTKVFKGKKNGEPWRHPAMGTLIVSCGKGMYRLNMRPPQSE